ncbi:MAG: hypothetical protein KC466_14915, partial [Myxococcales bacterium]|nr:hypothetical protein [Myxococcales bacterium]
MTVQPERLSRHANPTIKAAGLSHLLWERPDLDLAERFAADFGLGVTRRSADALHLRGSGPSSYVSVIRKAPRSRFVGFAWKAADRGDLDRVARIPGASGVEKIEGPGGGERVVLRDPHGFRVEVVHGIAEVESQPFGSSAPVNHPFEAR